MDNCVVVGALLGRVGVDIWGILLALSGSANRLSDTGRGRFEKVNTLEAVRRRDRF